MLWNKCTCSNMTTLVISKHNWKESFYFPAKCFFTFILRHCFSPISWFQRLLVSFSSLRVSLLWGSDLLLLQTAPRCGGAASHRAMCAVTSAPSATAGSSRRSASAGWGTPAAERPAAPRRNPASPSRKRRAVKVVHGRQPQSNQSQTQCETTNMEECAAVVMGLTGTKLLSQLWVYSALYWAFSTHTVYYMAEQFHMRLQEHLTFLSSSWPFKCMTLVKIKSFGQQSLFVILLVAFLFLVAEQRGGIGNGPCTFWVW